MRCHACLILPLLVCVITACQPSGPSPRPLIRDGMDSPSDWQLEGCTIEQGVLTLQGVHPGVPALAMRLLPPLPDTGSLVLGIRTRSAGADSALHVDLWGFGWDDPRQQMSLSARELTPGFTPAGTILPSGSADRGIWLRIFTSSTHPVQVDDVDLVYVPEDLWTRVAASLTPQPVPPPADSLAPTPAPADSQVP